MTLNYLILRSGWNFLNLGISLLQGTFISVPFTFTFINSLTIFSSDLIILFSIPQYFLASLSLPNQHFIYTIKANLCCPNILGYLLLHSSMTDLTVIMLLEKKLIFPTCVSIHSYHHSVRK